MVFETASTRWFLLILAIFNVAQGSVVFHPLSKPQTSSTSQESLPNYDTKFSQKEKSDPGSSLGDNPLGIDIEKRLAGISSEVGGNDGGVGYPVEYFDGGVGGMGWWPWQRGMAPVRRSYFVPRLGKRTSQEVKDDGLYIPCKELSEILEPAITPAELEHIRAVLDNNSDNTNKILSTLLEDGYDDDENDQDDNFDNVTEGDENDDICYWPYERTTRGSYSFAPRLGKRENAYAPGWGKRAYSFSPRLGKRKYSFAPRLGKRKYSFAPRLGKKAYSFAPRLGKRAYSFVPRLGKKSYSFVPRLGK